MPEHVATFPPGSVDFECSARCSQAWRYCRAFAGDMARISTCMSVDSSTMLAAPVKIEDQVTHRDSFWLPCASRLNVITHGSC